jgi:hypothetical protein
MDQPWIEFFINQVPAVAILGYWVYSLQKEKRELQQYIFETDKEKDKVLDNLANVIEKILDAVNVLPSGLTSKLETEFRLLLAEIKEILNKKQSPDD